jgi:tRNA threonylcarbamoyladenosine biosynthesis protein TsaB
MTTLLTPNGPLLAIETATRTAHVAIVAMNGDPLASDKFTADRHSTNLLGLCDRLFAQTQTTPAVLGAIACSAGPGSFTGLRVGMAVAKGLALPYGTRLVLVSSLRTLALDIALLPDSTSSVIYVPCIDAGKGEVHAQEFTGVPQELTEISEPLRLSPGDLCERLRSRTNERFVVAGPELAKFSELSPLAALPHVRFFQDMAGPSSLSLAKLALIALQRGEITDLGTAAPTYGRAPDITKPKPKTVGVGTGP